MAARHGRPNCSKRRPFPSLRPTARGYLGRRRKALGASEGILLLAGASSYPHRHIWIPIVKGCTFFGSVPLLDGVASEPRVATRDALTGALSRAMFDAQLPMEIEHSDRPGAPLSILLFDVDHFKSVNDAFGHTRGDEVLREVARRVATAIRGFDLLYRYGGDEFVVVLPNTGPAAAAQVARRLLDSVHGIPFAGHPPLSLSISVGVSTFPDDARSALALFECADQRIYQAKRQGRNRFVTEGGGAPGPPAEDPRLVEQDEALARTHQFLERLPATRRGVLRVTGAKGMGKSRFLAEVVAAARLRNHLVVSLTGEANLQTRPCATWLAGCPAGIPSPADAGVEGVAAALERLRCAANCASVVVVLDNTSNVDFRTCDVVSQLLLLETIASLGVVYGAEARSARTFALAGQSHNESVELSPLSVAGTQALLRSALRWEAPHGFVEWIHEEAGGVPGRIREVVQKLCERGLLCPDGSGHWSVKTPLDLYPAMASRDVRAAPSDCLPIPITEFVGREREQAQIHALIDRGRLVSLVGPGGIGKTRLALQIAAERSRDFADGARFVSLASTTDPGLVAPAIASALGIRQIAGKTVRESVSAAMRNKDMLLVLDNFEHVTAAAPLVSEIIRAAPGVRILVTSREPLRLSGEHVYAVPPLPLPAVGAENGHADAGRYAAVALFVLRAQAARYDFAMTGENTRDVVELCARLDGLPLALEIAAARTDQLTPRQLLDASTSFLLGASGPADLPDRQQTLRSVIGWSDSLLEPDARRLFTDLAVFAKGASIDAIAAVARPEATPSSTESLLDSLVLKSLLILAGEGESRRYVMLETVRAFAGERLSASGHEREVRDRHTAYFARRLATLAEALSGSSHRTAVQAFDRDVENFRAALAHERAFRPHAAATLGLGLAPFWALQGHWAEGLRWLDDLMAQPALAPGIRARCLLAAGRLASLQSDAVAARNAVDAARRIAESIGDSGLLATAAYASGSIALVLDGDYATALARLEEALARYRELGDTAGVVDAQEKLGHLAYCQGHHAAAERICNEALALARKRGDPTQTSAVTRELALVARARGDYGAAATLLEERLSTCEWLEDRYGVMDALLNIAELARSRADMEKASTTYHQYMALCRELGNNVGVARAVKDLGELARTAGNQDEAAELFHRALAMLQACGNVGEMLWTQRSLAEIAMDRSDITEARKRFVASLEPYREDTHPILALLSLGGLAAIAAAGGEQDKAARLIGASEALLETSGALLAVSDQAEYRQRVALIQHQLHEDVYKAGHAAGRAMSLAEAVALVCDGLPVSRDGLPVSQPPAMATAGDDPRGD